MVPLLMMMLAQGRAAQTPGVAALVTQIGTAAAQTTNANFSANPASGDLIVVMAHRDGSTTPPTLVTGYTTIDNTTGANTNSAILAFKFSDGTETGTGTWTNATSVVAIIYRNAGLGGWAKTRTAGTTSPMTYGTLTMQNTGGTSWVIGLGATKGSTDVGTNAPSGMTTQASATDIAVFSTGVGVASWSAQTAAVNGTPGATISYTLEIMAVPAGQLLYTFIQHATVISAGSATTAAVTLTQAVGSEPHVLVVAGQFSANPVEVVSIDKGGTLIPVVATSGGVGANGGASYGYVIGTTTATSPITVTFAGTTGGCNLGIWEIAYTGTGTPALDFANRTYFTTGTSVAGPASTMTGGNDFVLYSGATDHSYTAITNPYNSPTGYSTFPSGNFWAGAFNQTSISTPTLTINTTGAGGFATIGFGLNPTAFVTQMVQDFEGSSDGTTVTEALMNASVKGWHIGKWGTGGTGAAMKYATAASMPFNTAIARLNDGSSQAANVGTLGVEFLTSTTYSFITCDFDPSTSSGQNSQNSNSFSVGCWVDSDMPNSDGAACDVCMFTCPGGTGLANFKWLGNGSQRFAHLEVTGGGGTSSVNMSPGRYWVTIQYNRSASHVLKIYDSSVNLLGTITEAQSGTGMPGKLSLGQASSSAAPVTGHYIRIDSVKVDPTGTFPLLP